MLLASWARPRVGWARPRVQVPVTKTYRRWTRGRVSWTRPRVCKNLQKINKQQVWEVATGACRPDTTPCR
ncbi:hypothetical protein HanIR_Chr14g0678341 [Helianthus annuus]|nr:hypothetical protein HanIR_Chr14g0678341 [Helianthus annuus]